MSRRGTSRKRSSQTSGIPAGVVGRPPSRTRGRRCFGIGRKAREKDGRAILPGDLINLATKLRRGYPASLRTSQYMNTEERDPLQNSGSDVLGSGPGCIR